MLQVEEWDALSVEEQGQRMEEKPEGAEVKPAAGAEGDKEDVVIIDGKPRPLKNYLAERDRKLKEDILGEINAKPPVEKPPAGTQTQDHLAHFKKDAEAEIEETGSLIPVKTMAKMIGQATGYYMSQDRKATKAAKAVIRETKSELKSMYKNFSEHESRFDNIVDDIDPSQITKEGLKIVFNSLLGENMEERLKVARAEGAKEALEGKKIIGDTTTSTGQKTPAPSGKLTDPQAKEMQDMNFTSEEDYFGRLNKYKALAKQKNAKNVPELISEPLVY